MSFDHGYFVEQCHPRISQTPWDYACKGNYVIEKPLLHAYLSSIAMMASSAGSILVNLSKKFFQLFCC